MLRVNGIVAALIFSVALVVLIVGLPAGPYGQTAPAATGVTVLGSVVDAGLTPIAGASVVLEQNGRPIARATTDKEGKYRFASVAPGSYRVRATHAGFPAFARDVVVPSGVETMQLPIVMTRPEDAITKSRDESQQAVQTRSNPNVAALPPPGPPPPSPAPPPSTPSPRTAAAGRGGFGQIAIPEAPQDYYGLATRESYAHVPANQFQSVRQNPLSTFGADVDTASYTNVRRFLSLGQLPPRDAVRVEELVNYFRFPYAEPRGPHPISLTTEIGECPWAPSHKLVLIGARAKASAGRQIEGRNIVLLIDVSGSMAPEPRLPLLRKAFGMFVDTLRPDDRVAIVTYAGTSGVALPSTPARRRDVIQQAIAGLGAGGSTNGAGGLITAYRVAREAFIPGGVNRVILATDGDFNVGITSQQDLYRLIERERDSGVFLSVFGVGTGNLRDSTMELLADKGNGHYAYLDTLQEARRVLITEADSTLETIAKDVKFQVEFNPAVVSAYKLVGYENRLMPAEHFNDDRKDGGEMGAGHTVTVLYEVIPAGTSWSDDRNDDRPAVDPLRYQDQAAAAPVRPAPAAANTAARSGEWLTVKVRYKQPEGETSALITHPVRATGGRLDHLPFASAVADFGLLLRDERHDQRRWDVLVRRVNALTLAPSMTADKQGFVELVNTARGLLALR